MKCFKFFIHFIHAKIFQLCLVIIVIISLEIIICRKYRNIIKLFSILSNLTYIPLNIFSEIIQPFLLYLPGKHKSFLFLHDINENLSLITSTEAAI